MGASGSRCSFSSDTASVTLPCDVAIKAAGAQAFHIARLAGVGLPIVPLRIYTLITETIEGLPPGLPVVRFPDSAANMRPDVKSLLVGSFEPDNLALHPDALAFDAPPPDTEHD